MKNFKDITPDDPIITAYALGEITDSAELAALEQAIANNPALAAAVEDIRATAELLGGAFTEDAITTDAPQPSAKGSAPYSQGAPAGLQGRDAPPGRPHTASQGRAQTPVKPPSEKKVVRFPGWLGLAAAAAVAALIGGYTVYNQEPNIREVGQMPAQVEPDSVEANEGSKEVLLKTDIPEEIIEGTPMPIVVGERLTNEPVRILPPDPNSEWPELETHTQTTRKLHRIQEAPSPNPPKVLYDLSYHSEKTLNKQLDEIVEQASPESKSLAEQNYPIELNSFEDFKAPKAPEKDKEGLTVQPLAGPGEAASAGDSAVVAMRIGGELVPFVPASNLSATAPQKASTELEPKNISVSDFYRDAEASRMPSVSTDMKTSDRYITVDGQKKPITELSPRLQTALNRDWDMQSKEEPRENHSASLNGLAFRSSTEQEHQPTPASTVLGFTSPSPAEAPASQPGPDYRFQRERSNTEGYLPVEDNAFESPLVEPLSTFSIDVDTASYANVRRFIEQGQLPPPDAVRIEELINYFPYDYPAPGPEAEHPLAVYLDAAPAPWASEHSLVRVAMKAEEIAWEERPASNLVFLLDVSGSMNNANKLPLVKDALAKLIRRLDERDRVAIVVYAGASGLVLPSTTANNQETISHALNNLKAGGSTNGGQGLALAYKVARENLLEDGNNRIILCSDGDFNVGVSDKGEIATMAAANAKDGIFLTVLGFGMGNYKDDMLETLSNRGNGNYAYIDNEKEARKVFVEQAAGTLLTVAKDVKIQVEFNPAAVKAYRLIGYENRILAARDFNDDTKDAGEVGAGHTVTALYEVVPVGADAPQVADIDALKYQDTPPALAASAPESTLGSSQEWLTVKMRYKLPEADTSTKLEFPLKGQQVLAEFAEAPTDFRFAAAVAEFGMVLRNSPHKGSSTLTEARNISEGALGNDPGGHRMDFVELLEKAIRIKAE